MDFESKIALWKGVKVSFQDLNFMNMLLSKEGKPKDNTMYKIVKNPLKFSNHLHCVSYKADY